MWRTGGCRSKANRNDEEGRGALDGVGVVGVANYALRLGPARSCSGPVGRGLREMDEVSNELGDLLVGFPTEEVLAAGIFSVGEGADLEGEAEINYPLEAVFRLVLLEILVVQRLDTDDLGERNGVKEGLLADDGEGDDVSRNRDSL